MYKSGKRLRHLVSDPNRVIAETPTIRTIDDVLHEIANEKFLRSVSSVTPLIPSLIPSLTTTSQHSSAKRQKTRDATKSDTQSVAQDLDFRVFKVIYGVYKPNKKHKQFSSDGFLTVGIKDRLLRLYSIEGKGISNPKAAKSMDQMECGNRLVIGSRELEIDEELSPIEFKNRKYFIQSDDSFKD